MKLEKKIVQRKNSIIQFQWVQFNAYMKAVIGTHTLIHRSVVEREYEMVAQEYYLSDPTYRCWYRCPELGTTTLSERYPDFIFSRGK
jgi:hypothetical protein